MICVHVHHNAMYISVEQFQLQKLIVKLIKLFFIRYWMVVNQKFDDMNVSNVECFIEKI